MFHTDLLLRKRILITGGGTGLGKGMAQRFLELGAEVYICGRREDVLKTTAAELSAATGGRIHAIPCDVRELDSVESMIDTIWRDAPLDILVNNAAVWKESASSSSFDMSRISTSTLPMEILRAQLARPQSRVSA